MKRIAWTMLAVLACAFAGGRASAAAGLPSFDHYRIIVERNLFDRVASRTTVSMTAVSVKPAETLTSRAPANPIVLTGIVAADGVRRALFEQRSTGTTYLVGSGEAVDGAVVRDVEDGAVMLRRGEQDVRVDLGEAIPAPGAAPAVTTGDDHAEQPAAPAGGGEEPAAPPAER